MRAAAQLTAKSSVTFRIWILARAVRSRSAKSPMTIVCWIGETGSCAGWFGLGCEAAWCLALALTVFRSGIVGGGVSSSGVSSASSWSAASFQRWMCWSRIEISGST